ncbi:MAG: carbohydrate ABC transporter permease [Spirochaetes bacterium]|nr:carbohydrate ABC transporter permease [Spirochaetota bacterium]
MIFTSLKVSNEIFVSPPTWFPKKPILKNYIDIWHYVKLANYFKNSGIYAIGTTVLTILIALPASYATARIRFRGRMFFLFLILVTQMFSPIVVIISLYKMMAFYHSLNTYRGIIVTYSAFNQAFSIWLLTGYFSSIPKDIEEAAMIDGCSRFTTVVRILIPLAKPGIVATVVFVFIWAWNEFLLVLTFISTNRLWSLTLGIYGFIGKYKVLWNYLMAVSFLTTIPVIILFLLIERHLVSGLTAGAIK